MEIKKTLTLEEAKELYFKTTTCEEKAEKQQLREELILGTVGVVYQAIYKSKIFYFSFSDFDILDVLDNALELWILAIDNGVLEQIQFYSEFIWRKKFFGKLQKRCRKGIFYAGEIPVMSFESHHLIWLYLEERRKKEISFAEFQEKNQNASYLTYQMFEKIFQMVSDAGIFEEKRFRESSFSLLAPYLIEEAWLSVSQVSQLNHYGVTEESQFEKKILLETLKELLEASPIRMRHRTILLEHFWNEKTLKQISKQTGVSYYRIKYLKQEALKRLYCSSNKDQEELIRKYDEETIYSYFPLNRKLT